MPRAAANAKHIRCPRDEAAGRSTAVQGSVWTPRSLCCSGQDKLQLYLTRLPAYPRVNHILQNNVGENSSEFFLSSLKACTNHVLCSQLLGSRQCRLLCNSMRLLGLELSLHTPWTTHWDFHPGLQLSSVPESQMIWILFFSHPLLLLVSWISWSSSGLQWWLFSSHHLQECRDEHRVPGSDTDRSHTAPRELLKCYKDEPYGQPQHLRPLIRIFKQLWLMRQLLQVWDQWKCNLIFWTQLLNFFVPFSAENPIKPFLCRQKLSGTLHVDLSCIFLFLPPPPCLQFVFESFPKICTAQD